MNAAPSVFPPLFQALQANLPPSDLRAFLAYALEAIEAPAGVQVAPEAPLTTSLDCRANELVPVEAVRGAAPVLGVPFSLSNAGRLFKGIEGSQIEPSASRFESTAPLLFYPIGQAFLAFASAALAGHVEPVILVVPCKKVRGLATHRIVAAMQNLRLFLCQSPASQNKRYSVRRDGPFGSICSAAEAENPITSAFSSTAGPFEAAGLLIPFEETLKPQAIFFCQGGWNHGDYLLADSTLKSNNPAPFRKGRQRKAVAP